MGDGTAKRTFLAGPFRVDMDPLVIVGGVRESGDSTLSDLEPVTGVQCGADEALNS
ncbi:hypothetical protein GFS60_01315 [Rhodococcus sp. WAY2]|nr:hypothetical protein GFS60_01315 [Rhodococcus sp. WAY2]